MNYLPTPPRRFSPISQRGFFLIEALIAIVIFAFGVLALIGLQSVAIRETTESKMRADASYLADKIIGDLATTDLQTAASNGSPIVTSFSGPYTATTAPPTANATIYTSWQNLIARTLPGGTAEVTIESSTDPLDIGKLVHSATITVTWQVAGGPTRTFSQTGRLVD